jgi:hypothetical protein
MLHLLGVRLHPAIGIALGCAVLAAAALSADVTLGAVGVVMMFATVFGRIAARPDPDDGPGAED